MCKKFSKQIKEEKEKEKEKQKILLSLFLDSSFVSPTAWSYKSSSFPPFLLPRFLKASLKAVRT